MKIPRQHSRSETIEPPKFIQATKIAKRKQIPCIEHLIPVPKADSTIMIEITPNSSDHNINIFLSYESIPTYRSFMFHTKVEDLPISDTFGNEYKQNIFFKLSF